MEPKKISFAFTKTKKVEKPVIVEQKDFIDCLEGKSIKILGGEKVEEKQPLVIPLKPNTLVTAERLNQIAEEVEKSIEELDSNENVEPVAAIDTPIPKNETLEQMAARELLQEAKKEVNVEISSFSVPLPTQPALDGQKESTLDDYENVPVGEFGKAMLRGMGWTQSKESKYKPPNLRPKGLGLGADKVLKKPAQKKAGAKEEEKEVNVVKGGLVKITSGKHSGFYGKVVSLDEDSGRVVVDVVLRKETVSLSEFMMHPVTKTEYEQQSRVLNSDKYQEYKNKEHQGKSIKSARTTPQSDPNSREDLEVDIKNGSHLKEQSSDRHRENRELNDSSDTDDDRKRRKHKEDKKRYSSSDSLSSLSDSPKKSKKSKKHKKRDTHDGIRDVDKKRKGKKKKRDRDRSPSSRKYRK